MKFTYLFIFISLNLALVATHAELPPEMYWKSKLQTAQMPKAITDLIHPSTANGEANGKSETSYDPNRFFIVYGKDYDPNRFFMVYGKDAASETQLLHENPNVALFFLEKDLHLGTKLNMQFKKTSNYGVKFLSREVANSIPFSSNKVENILNHFSIKEGSDESKIVKNTINECEENDIKGEEKSCVTSLESMIDFATSILGNNVEAVSTEVNKESDNKQQYIVSKGVKKLGENKIVACHKQNYPYAVFYCHKIDATKVYSVPLEGADGNKIKAISVCHTNTSQWNPNHFAFKLFKVQPGTVPVCHFVPQDHVIWVSK